MGAGTVVGSAVVVGAAVVAGFLLDVVESSGFAGNRTAPCEATAAAATMGSSLFEADEADEVAVQTAVVRRKPDSITGRARGFRRGDVDIPFSSTWRRGA